MGEVQIGEFPGVGASRGNKFMRSIVNPLDKATIVSIFPALIDENKPTVFPGRFTIQPGSLESPSILVVGPSSWFRESPNLGGPMDEFPNSAVQMAQSVVVDYCNGLLGCDMDQRRPGLFYIPGELTVPDVKMRFANDLVKANAKQMNWFKELVRLADSLWARSNGNPLGIWDVMRKAAVALGQDKPWLSDNNILEKVKCNACGNLRDPNYPICPACKVIDKTHPLAGELTFAQ